MIPDIDSLLSFRNRTLRILPGKLLLGPTGARLWADYLDPVPGFQGRIDFIHKLNIPMLFSVCCEGCPEEMLPLDSIWHPSMLEMNWQNDLVSFNEYKFITWNDIAVSVQRWENIGASPVKLSLRLPDYYDMPSSDGWITARIPVSIHGIEPVCVFYCPRLLCKGQYTLMPEEQTEFIIAAAMGNSAADDPVKMKTEILKLPGLDGNVMNCVEHQKKEYLKWFDNVPAFESSDPLLNVCYWYRWFILRHNMARPDFGNFHHTLFYEGRSHKTKKEIYKPSGWEFTKLIPLSTPLHLTDSRWYGDGELSKEALRSLFDSMDENGLFKVTFTDASGNEYSNFAAWALYRFYLVHDDILFIKEVLPWFKKNSRGVYKAHETANDHLQIEAVHQLTGKEYQPSYWYFFDYPDNPYDKSKYTPLKRVDRSVYMYLNCLGIAYLCGILNDPDKDEFINLAENIKTDILEKMWDGNSHFFYDLHHETDEQALVKNIVGIYPLWAGITGPEHLAALDHLFDPEVFNTGSVFASTGKDCPVFTPEGGWKKQYFKGRDGCMWNGPSWPYTSAIALDAIANQSKQFQLGLDSQFMKFLRTYSLQHFQGNDIHKPYLVEHYNSITGEAISDDVDYNHSFYIDLIIRHIAGIEPEQGGFTFYPSGSELRFFSLENIKIQGHTVDISFRAASEEKANLTIKVDGVPVYENSGLPERAITIKFDQK